MKRQLHSSSSEDSGFSLYSLDMSIVHQSEINSWKKIFKLLSIDTSGSKGSWSGHFVGLPKKIHSKSLFLTGHVHTYINKSKEEGVHWTVRHKVIPETKPPKNVAADSKKVGGIDGLNSIFSDSWPLDEDSLMNYSISYLLDPRKSDMNLIKPSLFGTKEKIHKKSMVKRNMVSWSISPPAHGVETVSISEVEPQKEYLVVIDGNKKVNFKKQLLVDIDKYIWSEVQKCLLEFQSIET